MLNAYGLKLPSDPCIPLEPLGPSINLPFHWVEGLHRVILTCFTLQENGPTNRRFPVELLVQRDLGIEFLRYHLGHGHSFS